MSERPIVVVTHRVEADVVARLAAHAHVIANETDDSWPTPELRRHVARADAILAFMPDLVDEAFLDACPRLRIVAGALKGADNFDVEACTRRGIWLTNVADLLTVPTAELAVGLAIALARNVRAGDDHVRSGRFEGWRPRFYGTGLSGEAAGIIGMGAIGRALARRLRAFDAEVVYTDDRPLEAEKEDELGVRRVPLDELVRRSRYLFPLTPLTPATRHLVDDALLARTRTGAFLVNVGRGSLVDEEAVARALESGRLAGYAADVFEMEDWARRDRPRSVATALRADSRTLFTPHLGSAVLPTRHEIALRAAANVLAVFRGERPPDAINDPEIALRAAPC